MLLLIASLFFPPASRWHNSQRQNVCVRSLTGLEETRTRRNRNCFLQNNLNFPRFVDRVRWTAPDNDKPRTTSAIPFENFYAEALIHRLRVWVSDWRVFWLSASAMKDGMEIVIASNQAINRLLNRQFSQPINQSIRQTKQPIKLTTNHSNPSINQSIARSVFQPTIEQSINQSIDGRCEFCNPAFSGTVHWMNKCFPINWTAIPIKCTA